MATSAEEYKEYTRDDDSDYGESYWEEDTAEAMRRPEDDEAEAYGLDEGSSGGSSTLLEEVRRGMSGRRV